MNVKNILVVMLIVIAGAMIYLGTKASMKPPILTGVGFIIIAGLFLLKKRG